MNKFYEIHITTKSGIEKELIIHVESFKELVQRSDYKEFICTDIEKITITRKESLTKM